MVQISCSSTNAANFLHLRLKMTSQMRQEMARLNLSLKERGCISGSDFSFILLLIKGEICPLNYSLHNSIIKKSTFIIVIFSPDKKFPFFKIYFTQF